MKEDYTSTDLPGLSSIGHGYDVRGEYGNASASRAPILKDIDNEDSYDDSTTICDIKYVHPSYIHVNPDTPNYYYDNQYGETSTQYSYDMCATASLDVSYLAFSASFKSSYSTSLQESSDTQFQRINNVYELASVSIEYDTANIIANLDGDFVKALAEDDITGDGGLFDTYGTHLLKGLMLGGKLEYSAYSKATSSVSTSQFQAEAKMSYKIASGDASIEVDSSTTTESVSSENGLIVVGGDITTFSTEDWTPWHDTIKANPGFIDFIPSINCLLGIWELCTDEDRKAEIETAYKEEMAMMEPPMYIRRFVSTASAAGEYPTCEYELSSADQSKGYKVISGGALVTYSDVGLLLTSSYPIVDPSGNVIGWKAEAKDQIKKDTGTVQVFFWALYDPNDKWDVKSWNNKSASASQPSTEVSVDDGWTLTGGGAFADYGSGAGSLLTSSYPDDSLKTWKVSSKDHKTGCSATITSYAIGIQVKTAKDNDPDQVNVNPPTVQKFDVISSKGAHPSVTLQVKYPYTLVGAGARDSYVSHGNMLTSSYPDSDCSWTSTGKDQIASEADTSGQITIIGIGIKGATVFIDEDAINYEKEVETMESS